MVTNTSHKNSNLRRTIKYGKNPWDRVLAAGPMGLLIERDLYFEPKSLKELMEMHKSER